MNQGRLRVVTFSEGGITTDAVLMLTLMVFLDNKIFESSNYKFIAENLVKATNNYNDFDKLAEICRKTNTY